MQRIAVFTVLALGCGGAKVGHPGPDPEPRGAFVEVLETLDYAGCNPATCHGASDPAEGLAFDLPCAEVWELMLSPRVGEQSTRPRLEPAMDTRDPDNAFSTLKLGGQLGHDVRGSLDTWATWIRWLSEGAEGCEAGTARTSGVWSKHWGASW